MSRFRCNIFLIIILGALLPVQAYSQQINYPDSLAVYNFQKVNLKPRVNYSAGSTFLFVPHLGTVTGFTLSPSFTVPLSAKVSVEGGIIAGHYYSVLSGFSPEGVIKSTFNELSIYGSASYHISSQLTVYGIGIKQLSGSSPLYLIPKSSYAIGSNYNFGNFSVGITLQMSKWNDNTGPFLLNGTHGFYSPFQPGSGTLTPFGL